MIWVVLCGVLSIARAGELPPLFFEKITTSLPEHGEMSQTEAERIVSNQAVAKKHREAQLLVNSYPFQILNRQEVNLGDRKLITNLVTPPDLPTATVIEHSSATPHEPTLEELASLLAWQEKEQVTILLSATVYDHRITKLRWRYEGREYTAWSSIDFNYLRGVSHFETEDTDFLFMMGIGDMSGENLEVQNRLAIEKGSARVVPLSIPKFEGFTAGNAEYFVVDRDEKFAQNDAAFAGIEALHAYYERNAEQLQINYRNQEKLNAERKRYAAQHPEPLKDIIVNFWPIQSLSSNFNAEGTRSR